MASERTLPIFDSVRVARGRNALPGGDRLDQASRVLAAIASPSRLAILVILDAAGEMCVSDIASTLDATLPNASQQLRRLRDAGLVRTRDDGKLLLCSVSQTPLAAAALRLVRAMWSQSDGSDEASRTTRRSEEV